MPPPWSEVEVSSPQGGELSGVTKVHLNRSYSKRTMCFDERLNVHCYLESRLQCKESPITDPEHWWCWIFNASCSLEENQSQSPIVWWISQIPTLELPYGGQFWGWAILSKSVIRIAHLNYACSFRCVCASWRVYNWFSQSRWIYIKVQLFLKCFHKTFNWSKS